MSNRTAAGGAPAIRGGPVPAVVTAGNERMRVHRAWPGEVGPSTGEHHLVMEGIDDIGRVRAAQVRQQRSGTAKARSLITQVEMTPPAIDSKLPALGTASSGGQVVAHRFGKRAVLRYPDHYLKVVRPGKGPSVAAAAERFGRLATSAGFVAPRVLDCADGSVAFAVVPGVPLHDLGAQPELGSWRSWWQLWARAWPVFVSDLSARDTLPPHHAEDELQLLRHWCGRVESFAALPGPARARLAERFEALSAELAGSQPQSMVLCHRDLHDKQILAGGGALGLLDFDTATLAEPALDLANLLVHLQLRQDQGTWPAESVRLATRAVLDVAGQLAVNRRRLAAYAEATRLRLACLYAFRPRHWSLAMHWAGQMRDLSS